MTARNPTTSYADAGVSIDRGDQLVSRIKKRVDGSRRPGVMGGLGGFGALFDMAALKYRNPVLVSGTDGVGTKIKIAADLNRHDDIGIDLVAMCVNDLLVQGAEPLFFLDYYVCETLDVDVAERVIDGIVRGCEIAGCALVGGETAEHPKAFPPGEYDLAGFCVGVVEKDRIIDGSRVRTGDAVIALASSGPHSNGYSLIRKVLADSATHPDTAFATGTLADALLAPTRIYVRPVLSILDKVEIRAIAHITGGGLLENIPRVLPDGLGVVLDTASWDLPPIFHWLMTTGNIERREMHRTFNCGVGMILITPRESAETVIDLLRQQGEAAWLLGKVTDAKAKEDLVTFR
ncbi:MAG: phosphoribosylformylglycinamidine cyclo-ligase [Gammaproteobacteria bacterium]|nr:MAG: phosphoribosylformylglycinamidine cyclo-ligase [Gammaproteobacteria bacterium]